MRTAVAVPVILALATIAFGTCYPLFLSTSVPRDDIVDFYYQFLQAGGFAGYGFDQIYQWHNEHRLVVPKLWFLADLALADGRQTLLLAAIYVSTLLHAALLALIYRGLGHSARAAALAFLIAAAAMLSPVQYENLLKGFQIQFVQVWLFATLAVAFIAWAPVRTGRPLLLGVGVIAAILAGLTSTYSMINGLAIWPILVVFALWRRLPVGWTLLVAAVGGAVLALEVPGLIERLGTGGRNGVDAVSVVLFAARYLTSAIGMIGTLGQEIVGIVAVLAIVLAGVTGLLRPSTTPSFRMALYAICAFLVAAAVATAFGRLETGLGAANVSRYTTPSMVFLMSVGLLGIDALQRSRYRAMTPHGLAVSVILLLVPGLIHSLTDAPRRLVGRDQTNMAMVSHLAGGYRPETLQVLYPHWPGRAAAVLDGMQQAGLGPFSRIERFLPPEGALARPAGEDAAPCDGSVEGLQIDPVTGVSFAAWLSDARSGYLPSWIVARAPNGKVAAWGARLEWLGDRAPIPEGGVPTPGFRAFGPAPDPIVDRLTIEGVFDDGSRCRLPGTVAALPVRFLAELPPDARSAVSGGWSVEGTQLTGGTGEAAVPDAAKPVFGSFHQSDRRFSAAVTLGAPNGALGVLVPVHTQRWPFRATIALVDPTGRTLDQIDLGRPARPNWVWAVLRPAAPVEGMQVVVRTTGTYTENGIAFGTPHWLP